MLCSGPQGPSSSLCLLSRKSEVGSADCGVRSRWPLIRQADRRDGVRVTRSRETNAPWNVLVNKLKNCKALKDFHAC